MILFKDFIARNIGTIVKCSQNSTPEQYNDFVHVSEPDDGHIRPKHVVRIGSKGKQWSIVRKKWLIRNQVSSGQQMDNGTFLPLRTIHWTFDVGLFRETLAIKMEGDVFFLTYVCSLAIEIQHILSVRGGHVLENLRERQNRAARSSDLMEKMGLGEPNTRNMILNMYN
jgi:hypothetical protein